MLGLLGQVLVFLCVKVIDVTGARRVVVELDAVEWRTPVRLSTPAVRRAVEGRPCKKSEGSVSKEERSWLLRKEERGTYTPCNANQARARSTP